MLRWMKISHAFLTSKIVSNAGSVKKTTGSVKFFTGSVKRKHS